MSKRGASAGAGAGAGSESRGKRVRAVTGGLAEAEDFVSFINASPSPFHAVAECERRLQLAGFKKLSERDVWDVKPGGHYYTTRNQSSLVAFAVGKKYEAGSGFNIVAAHTDSPCLRVKPVSAKTHKGFLQVGVECYGGGLWHTWFDRDLGVAGRVIVEVAPDKFESRLVRISKPIMRVPTLAIHLNRTVNEAGFKFNKERHLAPVLAHHATAALSGGSSTDAAHHSKFLDLLAAEAGVDPASISNMELSLFDTNPSCLGGADSEFIYSARLDNLMMSYTSLRALIATKDEGLDDETGVRMIGLFDNEEVGSNSLMGAGSTLLEEAMRRMCPAPEAFAIAMRKSYLISADMAHASHPNFPDVHEDLHRPVMNGGMVVKTNSNQRYATTAVSSLLLKLAAKKVDSPIQEFVVRQDMGCGSTIGPILSSALGMRTVDVGIAQLSMHSIREMCGTSDVKNAIDLFTASFLHYTALDASISGGD